jgi:hypothetical protein
MNVSVLMAVDGAGPPHTGAMNHTMLELEREGHLCFNWEDGQIF